MVSQIKLFSLTLIISFVVGLTIPTGWIVTDIGIPLGYFLLWLLIALPHIENIWRQYDHSNS